MESEDEEKKSFMWDKVYEHDLLKIVSCLR